jgi:signal transduction histidine kinase
MQPLPLSPRPDETGQARDLEAACEATNGLAWLFTRLAASGAHSGVEPFARLGSAENAIASGATAKSCAAIGEIIVSEELGVSVAWLTKAESSCPSTQVLNAWYVRAARRPGRFVAALVDDAGKGAEWCGLLSWPPPGAQTRLAFFMRGAALPISAETAIGTLLNVLSMLVTRRRERVDHLPRLQLANERDLAPAAWLSMAADVLWEANADGVLRCRRVLNGYADAARLLDGINLAALRAQGRETVLDLLKRDGCVRNLRVEYSGGKEGIVINAETRPIGDANLRLGFRGTASIVATETDIGEHAANAIALSREIRLNADRERRGSESLVRGLRLLLEPGMRDAKLAEMLGILAQELHGTDIRVVRWRTGARAPSSVAPGDTMPSECEAALYAALDAALAGRASASFDNADAALWLIRERLGLRQRAIFLLALPSPREPAFLVCGTNELGRFDGAARSTLDRAALLLRHCLAMGEAADEYLQAAKMASIGHMAVGAMHEIRQPLSTIAMVAQNLDHIASHLPIDAGIIRKKADRLMGQVERAARVADRLSRFGRAGANRQAAVPLRQAVDNVCDLLAPTLSGSGVRLALDIVETLCVTADAAQLEQILVNLLQNALDALRGLGSAGRTDEGIVRISASATVSISGMPEILIRIEDNGAGFPRAMLNRISRGFFTTKPEGEGTGLGLAICETLARDNGGILEFGNHAGGAFAALRLKRAPIAP